MSDRPEIIWDQGSAYDLFISLWIIHRPDEFGLRPSWAAGVRSRLPGSLRDTLELMQAFMPVPMHWVYTLPEPKNAQAALNALKALPPEERLMALSFDGKIDAETLAFREFLLALDGKRRLTTGIEERILEFYKNTKRSKKGLPRALFTAWSDRQAFGEALLNALEAYMTNFFQEEESRIIPALGEALATAQTQSALQDPLTLVETLSNGVRMDWIAEVSTLILAPSFWSTPFVFFNKIDDQTGIILFGGRPKGVTLVPGEQVPEDLLNALKALADPTRLRILRYLLKNPATPSELATFLRLRSPTVVHHLRILRLAGANSCPNFHR